MKQNRPDFLSALQKLMPGTNDGNSFIEGTDTVVVRPESIHTYNDSISVSVVFPSGLSGVVKSKDFFKLLQKLSTEEIEIVPTEAQWEITAGSTKAVLNLKEDKISQYLGTLNLDAAFTKLPENFFEGMKLCRIPGNGSFLRGIYAAGTQMMSTDEIRLNYFTLDAPVDPFWIDEGSVGELLKLNEKMESFALVPGWVHFKGVNGTIFSCKRNQESSYPAERLMQYKKSFSPTEADMTQTLPMAFLAMIDRVGIMYTEIDGYHAVKVQLKKDCIIISSQTDAGAITETAKWEKPFAVDVDAAFQADFSFLKEAFNKCPDFYVRIGSTVDIVFHSTSFMQIMRTIAE